MLYCYIIPPLPTLYDIHLYLVMCKVYTDVGGIKELNHSCSPVWEIIHSLKLVDYPHIQVTNTGITITRSKDWTTKWNWPPTTLTSWLKCNKPWFNYYKDHIVYICSKYMLCFIFHTFNDNLIMISIFSKGKTSTCSWPPSRQNMIT